MAELGINEVNPLIPAADTHNLFSSGSSVFEEIATHTTQMIPAATVSGLYGVLNTPVEIANWLGADLQPFNTEETLRSFDDDLGTYYTQHKEAADMLGFIGTSVGTGIAGLKAIKLAQAGKMGTGMASAFNLVPEAKARALSAAVAQIGQDGTTIFSSIAANKLKALSLGYADNFIQAAVAESMAASLAAASPVFDGKDFQDIVWTVAQGALFGGAIGGSLDGILLNSQYRKSVKALEATKRQFEAVEAPGFSTLVRGDKIAVMLDSLLDIPEELASTNALRQTVDATQRRTQVKAIQYLNEMAGDDAVLGNQFADLVFTVRDRALAQGLTKEATKNKMADYLQQAVSMRRLNESDAFDALDPKKYLYPITNFTKLTQAATLDEWLAELMPRVKPEGAKGTWVMRVPAEELKIGMTAPSLDSTVGFVKGARKGYFTSADDAFEAGADVYVNMLKKKVEVNQASGNYVRTPGVTGETIVNLRTGQVVTQASRTVGDMANKADDIYIAKGGNELVVVSSEQTLEGSSRFSLQTFQQTAPLDWKTAPTLDASARYAWVERRGSDISREFKTPVQLDDFPLMEKLAQDQGLFNSVKDSAEIVLSPGQKVKLLDLANNPTQLQEIVRTAKLQAASAMREADPKLTNYLIAQRLNTTQDFLESGNPAGWTKSYAEVLQPSHAVVKYQTTPVEVDGMYARGLVALKQRQLIAKQRQLEAFTYVAGERSSAFMELGADEVRARASATGTGAGFFTSSSPEYGDVIGQWAQVTGKEARLWEEVEYAASGSIFADVAQALHNNPAAGTEVSMITEALRRTSRKYVIDIDGNISLKEIAEALLQKPGANREQLVAEVVGRIGLEDGVLPRIIPQFEETLQFFSAHTARNGYRVDKMNVLSAAQGFKSPLDGEVLYVPPIDTARFNYHAFVREKGKAVTGSNHVGVLVAKSEAELQRLASRVDADQYEVLFKKVDIEAYHKALGDYQYQLSLHENRVNTHLERKGLLYNYLPKTEPEAIMKEYFDWHYAQDKRLVTTAIETRYAGEFAELRQLGEQYTALGTSRFAGIGELFAKKVENPFQDYIRMATNVSKKSNYTLWMDANEFVEATGRKAYDAIQAAFTKAKEGKVTWQQANAIAENVGIPAPFKAAHNMLDVNPQADKAVMTEAVNKANSVLSTIALRLDWMNSINNIIASPINLGGELSSLRRMVAGSDELAGALKELTHVQVPGMPGVGVPSTTKLIAKAMKNYFGPDGKALVAAYKERGFILSQLEQHHAVLDTLSVQTGEAASAFAKRVDTAVELGAKITGNTHAEEFTRFVAADIMRQLTDPLVAAGRMEKALQNAYITTFVNRVQGNYLASQRPVLFQGVLGQALGLFQTYQFNLLQNLFRYIGNGDRKSAAVMMGLQTAIYGLNGAPFFDAANRVLIGNNSMNPYHKDAYSAVPEMVGKEVGEWLLYGTASAFPLFPDSAPSIYTRGDINPRHWSIVPLNPTDVPAYTASIKVVSNLLDMGSKLMGGADRSSVLLEGLEHNGISRPLAGIAQALQGYATTSKGSLISAAQDYSSIAQFVRVLGAKPASEAIALDGMYRTTAYKAKDRDRLESLGEIVKTKLRAGNSPTGEEMQDFMMRYAASGGDIKQFNAAMVRWYKAANQSQINALRSQLGSEYGRRMMELMGGEASEPIPDFMNQEVGTKEVFPSAAE